MGEPNIGDLRSQLGETAPISESPGPNSSAGCFLSDPLPSEVISHGLVDGKMVKIIAEYTHVLIWTRVGMFKREG